MFGLSLAAVACKPSDDDAAKQLCAKAAVMYERCESREGMDNMQWQLTLDRWRGLCRAVLTGETQQLLPNALELYQAMDDEMRAGLRVQAECTARATTCEQYKACDP